MEKIWLDSYEKGVSAEIDITQYNSVSDVFRQSVEKFADQPAFQNMGKTLTYAETGKLATDFASYLQNVLKLPRGERVAIMLPNVLQYPVALFGILQAGLVAVNTNPLYTPRELEHQLKDSGATAIIVLENFANTLELVLPRTQIKHVIVASVGEMFGLLKGSLINFVIRKIKKMVPEYRIRETVSFQTALKEGAKHVFQPVALNREDTALLQYTGGTTGVAKGAVLSHGNICANMLQAKEWIKNQLREGKETVIAALPLYHIFALTVNLMIFANAGSKIILITNPRDMKGFIGELKKQRVNVFIGVNTLFNAMVNRPDFAEVDFSELRLTLGGGMATQKAVAEKWKKNHRHAHRRSLRSDRSQPRRVLQPLKHRIIQRQHRFARLVHRSRTARRKRQRSPRRAAGRIVGKRPSSDARLLEPPRRNRQSHRRARLLGNRRYCRHGRKRLVEAGRS